MFGKLGLFHFLAGGIVASAVGKEDEELAIREDFSGDGRGLRERCVVSAKVGRRMLGANVHLDAKRSLHRREFAGGKSVVEAEIAAAGVDEELFHRVAPGIVEGFSVAKVQVSLVLGIDVNRAEGADKRDIAIGACHFGRRGCRNRYVCEDRVGKDIVFRLVFPSDEIRFPGLDTCSSLEIEVKNAILIAGDVGIRAGGSHRGDRMDV